MKRIWLIICFLFLFMSESFSQKYTSFYINDIFNAHKAIAYIKSSADTQLTYVTMVDSMLGARGSLMALHHNGNSNIQSYYFKSDSLAYFNFGNTSAYLQNHLNDITDSTSILFLFVQNNYNTQANENGMIVFKIKNDGQINWTYKNDEIFVQDAILVNDSILIFGGTSLKVISSKNGAPYFGGFVTAHANQGGYIGYNNFFQTVTDTLFYFCGSYSSGFGWRRAVVGLMTSSLNHLWTKSYSINNKAPVFIKIKKNVADDYYLLNSLEDTTNKKLLNVTKVDSIGNISWSKNYFPLLASKDIEAKDIFCTPDKGCIVLANEKNNLGQYTGNPILFKIDAFGQIIWSESIANWAFPAMDYASHIYSKDSNSILIDGNRLIQVDLNGWTCDVSQYLLQDSNINVFVDTISIYNKFDTTQFLYNLAYSTSIAPCAFPTIVNIYDSCLHTVSNPATSSNKSNRVTLFPNPSNGVVNIISDNLFDEIFVRDYTGRVVKKAKAKNPSANMQVDIRTLPTGIYFVEVYKSEIKIGSAKLLKVE